MYFDEPETPPPSPFIEFLKALKRFYQRFPLWIQYALIPAAGIVFVTVIVSLVAGDRIFENVAEKTLLREVTPPIVPDAKQLEQAAKDGYDDECYGNPSCKECKAGPTCLSCMHDCYNRYGTHVKIENPYFKQATSCVMHCWQEVDEKAEIKTNFDIPSKKDKKR